MCVKSSKAAITEGRFVYELYDEEKKGICQKDPRYHEFDQSKGELELFTQNHVNYLGLPRFTINDNFRYKRFARGIIEFKPNCLPYVDNFLNHERQINDYERRTKVIFIMCIVLLILVAILGLFTSFCITPLAMARDPSGRGNKIFLLTVIPRWFFAFYMIFLLLLTSFSASKHFAFFTEVLKNDCSDTFTNERAS